MIALTASFGAMAIFRSKLFIFRTEDGREYPNQSQNPARVQNRVSEFSALAGLRGP